MTKKDLIKPAKRIRRYTLMGGNLACLMLVPLLVVSCAIGRLPPSVELPLPPAEPIITLASGDEIDVKFRYWPELDESQTIRPDGKISLQLVDDVYAAGLTPEQLDEHLTKLYESKIKEPVITVIIRSLANQRIYVGGEVRTPGVQSLQPKLTVLDAIIAAGGSINRSAKLSNVVVIRHVGDKRYASLLDLRKALKKPESDRFYLAPGDIVFVPRTKIDKVNQWVDQYISRMIPSLGIPFGP